jgi:hypothetical protein
MKETAVTFRFLPHAEVVCGHLRQSLSGSLPSFPRSTLSTQPPLTTYHDFHWPSRARLPPTSADVPSPYRGTAGTSRARAWFSLELAWKRRTGGSNSQTADAQILLPSRAGANSGSISVTHLSPSRWGLRPRLSCRGVSAAGGRRWGSSSSSVALHLGGSLRHWGVGGSFLGQRCSGSRDGKL